MYSNPGDIEQGGCIPPHWHYISFGLSDLYGDGRVFDPITAHALQNSRHRVSGYGFELTFRLKKEHKDESAPPLWPATVMQSLAKYVFNSDNALCPGDHVSWHCSLDNSESRIRHMLMTEDPIGTVMTPYGSVTFVQIVGVFVEELQSAQQWNGAGLIGMMKSVEELGKNCLVTDMKRQKTIFELDDSIRKNVEDAISAEGSNLSGVTAKCSWKEVDDSIDSAASASAATGATGGSASDSKTNGNSMSPSIGHEDGDNEDRATLSPNGRNKMCTSRASRHSSMSTTDQNNAVVAAAGPPDAPSKTTFPKSVHLTLNLEAGNILPLAMKGRLKHDRHFTLKTVAGDLAVTMLTEKVSGAFASPEHPYALHGPWLQILIPSKSVESFIQILDPIPTLTPESLPKKFALPDSSFSITIAPDDH
jgi:suppressor of fused-like protein